MLALVYLLVGVALVVAAVAALAGAWWGILAAGLVLLVCGVLEARGAPASKARS